MDSHEVDGFVLHGKNDVIVAGVSNIWFLWSWDFRWVISVSILEFLLRKGVPEVNKDKKLGSIIITRAT